MSSQKIIAAGILPICPKTGRVCLNLRGEDQPQPLQWSCWGGKFEEDKDRTPKDCAKREFYEETRCVSPYTISKKEFYLHDTNHVQFWTYLGIFENEFRPDILSEGEAADWGWFKLSALPNPLLQGFEEMLCDNMGDLIKIVEKLR
jgi:ADP-ribose pyrophosphatase YjhB (NUDIX family)